MIWVALAYRQRQLGLAVFLWAASAAVAQAATIRGLEEQGDPFSFRPGNSVSAISPDGTVVVTRLDCPPNADCIYLSWPHLQRWQTAGDLGFHGMGYVTGLSGDGSRHVGIVSEAPEAFGYLGDMSVPRGVAERFEIDPAYPLDISRDGQQVAGTFEHRPFLWNADSGTRQLGHPAGWESGGAFGLSSDGSAVVGELVSADIGHAFRWTQQRGYEDLHGFQRGTSAAFDASSDGSVVTGTYQTSDSVSFFRWTEASGMVLLGEGVPVAMSDDGSVILGNRRSEIQLDPQAGEPFIWTEEEGVQDLADALTGRYGMERLLEGWDLAAATGMSADGLTLVGLGTGPNEQTSWLVTLADTPACDVNADGVCDNEDIHQITRTRLRLDHYVTANDLDLNLRITQEDRRIWVEDLVGTAFGDSNLDGAFDSGDLVQVMVAGQYEDGLRYNSTWATGDWDGDLEFTTGDLVFALQKGGYESARAVVHAVPEGTGGILWLCLLLASRRKGRGKGDGAISGTWLKD